MKWKLIFLLSLFGLAMAFATVFWIPLKFEPVFWLVIFIICAYLIAKNCTNRYFLHGFLIGLANCVWITGIHIIYFQTYWANHPGMAQRMADMPMSNHPLRMMTITSPVVGIVSGLVLGLLAFLATKLIKKSNP
jgi:hypothetical protein